MASIGAAVFGGVCLIIVFAGIIYMGSVYSAQNPITDTYGNTLSPVSNASKNLTGEMTDTGTSAGIWLVLIVGGVLACVIIFALYLVAKVFFH